MFGKNKFLLLLIAFGSFSLGMNKEKLVVAGNTQPAGGKIESSTAKVAPATAPSLSKATPSSNAPKSTPAVAGTPQPSTKKEATKPLDQHVKEAVAAQATKKDTNPGLSDPKTKTDAKSLRQHAEEAAAAQATKEAAKSLHQHVKDAVAAQATKKDTNLGQSDSKTKTDAHTNAQGTKKPSTPAKKDPEANNSNPAKKVVGTQGSTQKSPAEVKKALDILALAKLPTGSPVSLTEDAPPKPQLLAHLKAAPETTKDVTPSTPAPTATPPKASNYSLGSMFGGLGSYFGMGTAQKKPTSSIKPASMAEATASTPIEPSKSLASITQTSGDQSTEEPTVSPLNSLWSRMWGYTDHPPQKPAPEKPTLSLGSNSSSTKQAESQADIIRKKLEDDLLNEKKQRAELLAKYTRDIYERSQRNNYFREKERMHAQQLKKAAALFQGTPNTPRESSASSGRKTKYSSLSEAQSATAHTAPTATLSQLTSAAATIDPALSLSTLIDNGSGAQPYSSLAQAIENSYRTPQGYGTTQQSCYAPHYALPPYLEPYRHLIEPRNENILMPSLGTVSLENFTRERPENPYLFLDRDDEESRKKRQHIQNLVRKFLMSGNTQAAMAIQSMLASGAYSTPQAHIANMTRMPLDHIRFYRHFGTFNADGIINIFASNHQGTKQRDPEDIKPPRGNPREKQYKVDYEKYVQKLKRRYSKITPATQAQLVKSALDEHKKEAEVTSYEALIEQTSSLECQLSFVYEEYRPFTGNRNIPDVQAFCTGEHAAQLAQIDSKPIEQQSRFYERETALRELELKCAILQNQIKHNQELMNTCKQDMQSKNDAYQQSIAQYGMEKLAQEEMPSKTKQIEDTKAHIDHHNKQIAANEAALEKTAAKLESFSANFVARAAANTSAALDSDNSKKQLAEKKAELETRIHNSKKLVAKLENERTAYKAQLDYVEKRVEHYSLLQEAYAPFIGVSQEKMTKEDSEIAHVIKDAVTNNKLESVLVKGALNASLDNVLVYSNIDKRRFEEMRGDPVQNFMYQKFNDMLKVAADAQSQDPKNAKFKPYNQAVAMLWAHGQAQNQQGQINAAIRTYKTAHAISLYIQAKASGVTDAVQKAEQAISDSLGQAIQRINDSDTLADLKREWETLKASANPSPQEIQKWLTVLSVAMITSVDNPTNTPAAIAGVVGVAIEAALCTRTVVAAGAIVAAGATTAIDPKSSFFDSIDNALKSDKVTSAIKDNEGGSGGSQNNPNAQNFDKIKITNKMAVEAAEKLGFIKTNFQSQGQAVFRRGNKYISIDVDAHNGGFWKMADSVKNLAKKSTRMGTYDKFLNRIGD